MKKPKKPKTGKGKKALDRSLDINVKRQFMSFYIFNKNKILDNRLTIKAR